jgi:hypothetical protein
MFEMQLAARQVGNKIVRGKSKQFDSAYALWKFFEDERPGVLDRQLDALQGKDQTKKARYKKPQQ